MTSLIDRQPAVYECWVGGVPHPHCTYEFKNNSLWTIESMNDELSRSDGWDVRAVKAVTLMIYSAIIVNTYLDSMRYRNV